MRGLAYAIAAALLVPTAPRAAETGNVCVRHYSPGISCIENDVQISKIQAVTVLEDCPSGDPSTAQATFRVWASAGNSSRSDVGLFLALNGDSALSGGNCFHDYLEPPLVVSPTYGDFDANGGPDLLNGPWWDGEPFAQPQDLCGDIQAHTDAIKTVTFRVACIDHTGNGVVDVDACTSWSNGPERDCDQVTDAYPPSSMRCGCTLVETGMPLTGGAAAGRIAGLTLQRLPTNQLQLSWSPSCAGGDNDYGIYEGALGQFSSHRRVVCTTGGATSATIQPAAGNRYFLVVPRNALREGSYGKNGAGIERPPASDACLLQQVLSSCP